MSAKRKRYIFIGRAYDDKGTEVLVWFCLSDINWYGISPEAFWRK